MLLIQRRPKNWASRINSYMHWESLRWPAGLETEHRTINPIYRCFCTDSITIQGGVLSEQVIMDAFQPFGCTGVRFLSFVFLDFGSHDKAGRCSVDLKGEVIIR